MFAQAFLIYWFDKVCIEKYHIVHLLIYFSLTVKAVTFEFISGRGSTISSAKQRKAGSFYYLVKNKKKLFGPHKRACIENPNRIHTELTFINPLSA